MTAVRDHPSIFRHMPRAACVVLLLWSASQAELRAQAGLKIELVPETTAIVPGREFRVGLFIRHDPGWHTYWRQPGIVGVPTQIEWELPAGFRAGELEYPAPESVLMFHIKAQGYERDVLLQTRMTAPADLQPGEKVRLSGLASWMCCGNTCHPGSMRLALEMPVAAKAEPHARWAPLFEKERQAFARESPAWRAEAEEDGMKVTLTLRPEGDAARALAPDESLDGLRFFTEDGWINSDEDQLFSTAPDGSLTVTLTRAEVFPGGEPPARLHGSIQRQGGWVAGEEWTCLRFAPKITRSGPLKDPQTRR